MALQDSEMNGRAIRTVIPVLPVCFEGFLSFESEPFDGTIIFDL